MKPRPITRDVVFFSQTSSQLVRCGKTAETPPRITMELSKLRREKESCIYAFKGGIFSVEGRLNSRLRYEYTMA
jgi:hypothetical protein